MLSRLDEADAEFHATAERLVERLFSLVPKALDAEARRKLLELKRAAFNHRPLPQNHAARLTAPQANGIDDDLERYSTLLQLRARVLHERRELVLEELSSALDERVMEPHFRLALAASSETLLAALVRHSKTKSPLSARDQRSLYAYVCRFATKANPLHLFSVLIPTASVVDGDTTGDSVEHLCEIVFPTRDILALEGYLLEKSDIDPSRLRLQLNPLVESGERLAVWFKRKHAWGIAHVPNTPLLERIRSLYEQRQCSGQTPSFTRAELEQALIAGESAVDGDLVRRAVDRLVGCGVLRPYLISELYSPARELRGLHAASEPLIDSIERWHLAHVSAAQLRLVDSDLEAARPTPGTPDSGLFTFRYGVNAYANDDLTEAERAALEIRRPLLDLRDALTVESGFAATQRAIRAFLKEEVQKQEGQPLLDLLARLLRRGIENLAPPNTRPTTSYDALVGRCRGLEGELDRSELAKLTTGLEQPSDASVCFVGPFDFAKRRFYLTNTFAGDQRFVSRYFLRRRYCPQPIQDQKSVVDVELAVPPTHNLLFTVRRFDVGFSYESRWVHGYSQWMKPADVLVTIENGQPIYKHATTGKRLRFRYSGFLLAHNLPIEYQLLLVEHADSFRNPFTEVSVPPSATDVTHQPALLYGPICLRRETWHVRSQALATLLRSEDVVALTEGLRRWVREHLAPTDLWFYRVTGRRRRADKPRFLDLASPMSVMAFRHAVGRASGRISFSRMEPSEPGLWRIGDQGYAAELMVEV